MHGQPLTTGEGLCNLKLRELIFSVSCKIYSDSTYILASSGSVLTMPQNYSFALKANNLQILSYYQEETHKLFISADYDF
jgi:hypothetical protein